MLFQLAEPRPPQPPEPPEQAGRTQHSQPAGEGPAAAAAAPIDDRASVGEEAQTALMGLLPWAISFLLHLGLIVILFFAIWTRYDNQTEEEIIIPMVELSQTPGAPLQMRTDQRVREQSTDRRQIVQETSESQSEMSLNAEVSGESGLLGVAGGGSAGSDSPFGSSVASGAEFRTSFMGARGGNARRVAFVIDASGSLIDTFPFVIDELIKSINRLSDQQQFSVIFFQGNDAIEVPVPRRGLRPATGENKRRVIEWIDPTNHNIVPGGQKNPIPAIELALRYRPDVIFMLSDDITGTGHYAVDQRRLLNEIERVNSAGTRISTIQFLYPDPLEQLGLKGTMERIAEQSGGSYQFVDEQALGLVARGGP